MGAKIIEDFDENSAELPDLILCYKVNQVTRKSKLGKKLKIKQIYYLWVYYCFIFGYKLKPEAFDFSKISIEQLKNNDLLEEYIYDQHQPDTNGPQAPDQVQQ